MTTLISATTLGVFLLAVLALFAVPGPNMLFVMTHGVTLGPRGGLAAALGIGLADVVLTVLAAAGIAAAVMAMPASFELIRAAGALWLLWMAWGAWRSRAGQTPPTVATGSPHRTPSPSPSPSPSRELTRLRTVVLQSMLNSLLNPKALLFFMVFLPQFVEPGRAPVPGQLLMLGGVLTAASVVFHGTLGVACGLLKQGLLPSSRHTRWLQRALAVVLAGLAVRLWLLERPGA
jgi:threonine/homoserine/homoserine lactone efflux protein